MITVPVQDALLLQQNVALVQLLDRCITELSTAVLQALPGQRAAIETRKQVCAVATEQSCGWLVPGACLMQGWREGLFADATAFLVIGWHILNHLLGPGGLAQLPTKDQEHLAHRVLCEL